MRSASFQLDVSFMFSAIVSFLRLVSLNRSVTFGETQTSAPIAAAAVDGNGGGGVSGSGGAALMARQSGGVFCETEAFNATCEMGFVVVMTYAHYGRMKLSRCVKQDYGHVGCSADVRDLADYKCSARRKCTVRIPDAVFAAMKPCPDDLKPYLEAGYICVKVQTPRDVCDSMAGISVSDPQTGHLANLVTESTGCGGSRAPWLIHARQGQRIQLTLYDFSLGRRRYTPSPVTSSTAASYVTCNAYATVREPFDGRNVTIYGGKSRESLAYTSVSHVVEVAILTGEDGCDTPYFLMKYEVIGCPDVLSISNGWSVRMGDSLVIHCNNSATDVHRLFCSQSMWNGHFTDCSTTGVLPSNTRTAGEPEYITISHGVSAVIAFLTAITIGMVVLGLGLLFFRSKKKTTPTGHHHHHHHHSASSASDHLCHHSAWQLTGASKAAESWSRAASTSCGIIEPKRRIQDPHPSSSSVSALDDDLPVYSTPASLPYSAELVRHIRRPPVNQYDIVIDVTHFLSSSSSMKTTTAASSSSRQMRTTPSSPPHSSSSIVPEVYTQRPCTCPESILGSDDQTLASPDLHKQCGRTVDNDSPFPGGGQLEYSEDREMDDWSSTNPSSSPITTCTRHLDPSIHAIPLYCLANDLSTIDDRKQL